MTAMIAATLDEPSHGRMSVGMVGPRNVQLPSEGADGVLPLFWSPTRWRDAFGDVFDKVESPSFDLAPSVWVASGDDIDSCRDALRPQHGALGSRGINFYNSLVCRYGFDQAAIEIQDHFLAGRRNDAVAAVPDALVDELCLVGTTTQIADRLGAWRETPTTTLVIKPNEMDDIESVAEALTID
jgi:alkanesulfonate monooxygenase SsuD/methylene tetrahydromethanopterin reductase-like flavin-dependent oxidoreductase (luciferase family)